MLGSVKRLKREWAVTLTAFVTALLLWSASCAFAGEKVLVGFRGRPNAAAVAALGARVDHVYDLVPALAAEVPSAKLAALRRLAGVLYVEPDYPVYASELTPASWLDFGVGVLFDPGTEILPWGIDRVNAPAVWTGLTPNFGEGVAVAIIDTGLDYTHPDLADNYVMGYDFVNNDWDPKDDNGHGTHVAGIIAALDDGANTGGISVVGVAPRASLYIAKCLNANGSGSTSDIVAAINVAARYNIKVVNMSFGSLFSSTTLKQACNNAYLAGVLLVAAAGNEYRGKLSFPARYASVVSVGAIDIGNSRTGFSNYGDTLTLCAPGVNVLSTLPTYAVTLNNPTYGYQMYYDYLDGTSMACPHVVGAAALVYAAHPGWTNTQVRQQLTATAFDLGTVGWDQYYGYGLVDAAAAVQ